MTKFLRWIQHEFFVTNLVWNCFELINLKLYYSPNHKLKNIVIILNVKSVQYNDKLSLEFESNKAKKKWLKLDSNTEPSVYESELYTQSHLDVISGALLKYINTSISIFTYTLIYQTIYWLVEN